MFLAHPVGARISCFNTLCSTRVHPCPFSLPVMNSLQDCLTASVTAQGSIWFSEARLLESEINCHT